MLDGGAKRKSCLEGGLDGGLLMSLLVLFLYEWSNDLTNDLTNDHDHGCHQNSVAHSFLTATQLQFMVGCGSRTRSTKFDCQCVTTYLPQRRPNVQCRCTKRSDDGTVVQLETIDGLWRHIFYKYIIKIIIN